MTNHIFPKLDGIVQGADSYLVHDSVDATMLANGMPRQTFIQYSVINAFLRANHRSNEGEVTEEVLENAATLCADQYHMPKQELVRSYERVAAQEWFDPELRDKLDRERAQTFAP